MQTTAFVAVLSILCTADAVAAAPAWCSDTTEEWDSDCLPTTETDCVAPSFQWSNGACSFKTQTECTGTSETWYVMPVTACWACVLKLVGADFPELKGISNDEVAAIVNKDTYTRKEEMILYVEGLITHFEGTGTLSGPALTGALQLVALMAATVRGGTLAGATLNPMTDMYEEIASALPGYSKCVPLLTAATSSAGDSIPASPRDCIGPTFHWNRTGNPVGAGTSDPCGALSGKVAVDHIHDPGELNCDCVPKTDPCFDDVNGCVAESACFAQLLGAEEADNDDGGSGGSGSGDDDDEADPITCINAVCADTLARCYESVDCWADLADLAETIFDATSAPSEKGPLAEVTSCIEGNMTEIIDCLENGAELESFLEGSCALKTEADCNEEDEEWDTTDAKCIAAPPTTGTSTVTSTVASTVASTVTTTATSTVASTVTSTVSVTVASTATSSRASSATSTATTTETEQPTTKVQAVEHKEIIKQFAEFRERLAAVTVGNPNPEVTTWSQTAKISGTTCAETNTVETQKAACATMKNKVGFSADAPTVCIVQCNDVADSDDARRGRRQASAFARPGQALPIGLGPHGRRNANTVTAAEFMFMVLAAVGTERVATPTGTAAADFVFEVTTTSGKTITVSAPLSVVEFIAEWDSLLSGDAKSLRKYVHAKIETDGIVVIGEKSVAEGEEGTQKKKKKNRNGAALIGAIVTVLAIGTIGALVASEKLAKPQLKSNKVAAAELGLPDPAQQPRTPTRIQVDNFTPAANLKPSGGGGAEGAESQKSPTITGDIAHLIKATRPGPDVTQV